MKIDKQSGNRMFFLRIGAGCALFLFLTGLLPGCAGKEKRSEAPAEKQTFMKKWQEKADAAKGYSPGHEASVQNLPETASILGPTDAGASAESQPAEKEALAPRRPLPTEKIYLKMRDVELSVLLRALARMAGQNMMINENVLGRTSLNITGAPWDQVFLGILKTHGLTYNWEGDIIRIVTVDDLKKELELQKESQAFRIKSEEYKSKFNTLKKVNEPMTTRVIPIRYADLKALKTTVESVLKAREAAAKAESEAEALGSAAESVPGEVLVDEHSHSLVLYARKSDMDKLVSLIQDLDKPTPQIRIEAHIVEATENTARHLGVQWGGLFLNASGDRFNWVGSQPSATGQQLYDGNQNPQLSQPTTGNIVNNLPADVAAATASGGSLAYQFQKKGIGLLNVQLKALQESGELNILSSPSITTIDNKEATIESGKQVPFQTVEDGEVKIEFKDALLKLIVTPHVIDSRTLRLEIVTNNDELDFGNSVGGQPAITTKKAETTVVLFDGQTTVIGGLNKKNISENETGVPLAKDVPLLGWLFKGRSKEGDFEELLIFITPYILKERTEERAAVAPEPNP